MKPIYAIHAPDAEHLATVIGQMRSLGAPTIRVVDCTDYYMALEGSHRLAACKELGLEPDLDVLKQSDAINLAEYDWYEPGNWLEEQYTAGDVACELRSMQSVPYTFDDR